MVRTINATFDEKNFRRLENAKKNLSKLYGKNMSWEHFIIDMHNKILLKDIENEK
jgi:hypothetical protein